MSNFVVPDKELTLTTETGQVLVFTPEEYYILRQERNGEVTEGPIIKHEPLVKKARELGIKIPRPQQTNFVWSSNRNFYISFLVEDEDGIYGDGEANPNNLGKSPIAQGYPLIMAKKRAVDRYLIQKLGLAGKVYSDSEIPPTGILSEEIQEPVQIVEQVTDQEKVQLENKKEATSSTPKEGNANKTPKTKEGPETKAGKAKVNLEEVDLEQLKSMKVGFGVNRNKTLAEVPDYYLEFLATKFKPATPEFEAVKDAAIKLYEAKKAN